jgi:sporulation and cell division protein SsgA
MSTLVYETVDGAPGPILLDHTSDRDHVIVGAYGHAPVLAEACRCDEEALCRHPGGFAHAIFTWVQVAPYEFTIDFIQHDGKRVPWQIARELLRIGGGEGDVQVRRRGEQTDVELSTPEGTATLRIDQDWLDLLIATTDDIVPPAEEFAGVNWTQLLGGQE